MPAPEDDATTPAADQPVNALDDLYDIGRLAARLGVEHATIRVWLSRNVPWLPRPDGRLNGGAVWRASSLDGIEERRAKGRPGRKPRTGGPNGSTNGSTDSSTDDDAAPREAATPPVGATLA